jgi:hypothetical protein
MGKSDVIAIYKATWAYNVPLSTSKMHFLEIPNFVCVNNK